MPTKKKPSEERVVPSFTFRLPVKIKHSICTTKTLRDDFEIIVSENWETKSSVLRKIFFEALGLKSEEEFEKYLRETSKDFDKKIKEDLFKKVGHSDIQKIFEEGMRKYVKEGKK